MALPVALQLFTVRHTIEKDLEGTLSAIKDMGYDGIEACGCPEGTDPESFATLCKNIGLEIISSHMGTGDIIDETEKTLKKYKAMGCSYIAIAGFWGDYRYNESGYAEMIKRLDAAGAFFKKNGIQVLYHNHSWEFKPEKDGYELDAILNDVSDDNLLPEIDVCWATIGHGDAQDYLRKYDKRCPLVHLKDFYCKGSYNFKANGFNNPEGLEFRPVGYGRVDMAAVLDAAMDIGAKWVIVEEDTPAFGLSELECASLSRNWLKTMGW